MATTELLTPQTRDVLRQLELHARTIVGGLRYGLHRSKRRGVSTDFLHHRAYAIGDPLKYLDWKVLARTERYYVKQYVEDSAMTLWVALDYSSSMDAEPEVRYVEDQPVPVPGKWEVAARLAAALCCLTVNQQDRAGIVIAGERPLALHPGASSRHLSFLTHGMVSGRRDGRTDLVPSLRLIEEQARGGSVIAIISDLSFPPEGVQEVIRNLRARSHDVIVFHVLSPREMEFEFNRWVDFRCAETAGRNHRIDATLLRKVYRQEVEAFLGEWQDFCRKQRVDFVPLRTDADITLALNDYLRRRQAEG
jgi:uncharacterized protein (DUF58 family)